MVPNALKSVLRQFNLIRPPTEGQVFHALDQAARKGPFPNDDLMFKSNRNVAAAVARFKSQPTIPSPPLPKALRQDPIARVVWTRSLAGREALTQMMMAPLGQAGAASAALNKELGLSQYADQVERILPVAPQPTRTASLRSLLGQQRAAMREKLFGRKQGSGSSVASSRSSLDSDTSTELLINFAERKIDIAPPDYLSDRDKALWAADPFAAELLAARHQRVKGPTLPAGVTVDDALEHIEATLLRKISQG